MLCLDDRTKVANAAMQDTILLEDEQVGGLDVGVDHARPVHGGQPAQGTSQHLPNGWGVQRPFLQHLAQVNASKPIHQATLQLITLAFGEAIQQANDVRMLNEFLGDRSLLRSETKQTRHDVERST